MIQNTIKEIENRIQVFGYGFERKNIDDPPYKASVLMFNGEDVDEEEFTPELCSVFSDLGFEEIFEPIYTGYTYFH